MTCPECRDTGIISRPYIAGVVSTMTACTCDAGRQFAADIAALHSAQPVGARVTVKPGEIERAVWSAMIWAASNNAGFNGVPEYTDRGNSFAEDEARRAAARILAALLPAGEEG